MNTPDPKPTAPAIVVPKPEPFDMTRSDAVIADLAIGYTIDDVTAAFNDETLRIGAHVIAFPDGSSESAVTTPEPVTLVLLIIGGLAFWLRRLR